MTAKWLRLVGLVAALSTSGCPWLILHVGHCWHGTYPCGVKRCCNDCGLPCN